MKKDKSEKVHWLTMNCRYLGDDAPDSIECGIDTFDAVMTYDKKKVTCTDCLVEKKGRR